MQVRIDKKCDARNVMQNQTIASRINKRKRGFTRSVIVMLDTR
jgi:hypothetical protein